MACTYLSVRTGSNNERPSEVFPITLAGESRLCFVWCVGLIPSSSSVVCKRGSEMDFVAKSDQYPTNVLAIYTDASL